MATTYLALLGGINVGRNNVIRMTDPTRCLERCGFDNVATYIQSGNVVFNAAVADVKTITSRIESLLSRRKGPVREGVDEVSAGKTVLYASRLIAKAAHSRLSRVVSLPVYTELTVRNWNTTTKLLELMQA